MSIENPNALKNAAEVANELVKQEKYVIEFDGCDIGPFTSIKAAKESTNELQLEVERLIIRERESSQLSALSSLRDDIMCGGIGIDPAPAFASGKVLDVAKSIARSSTVDNNYYKFKCELAESDKTGLQSLVCFLISAVWALIFILIGRHYPNAAEVLGVVGGAIPFFIGVSIGADWLGGYE